MNWSSVDELVDIISAIAGKTLVKRHDTSRPQGVRGRNSDNSRLRSVLGWEPKTPLRVGLVPTYRWIEACVSGQLHQPVETAAEIGRKSRWPVKQDAFTRTCVAETLRTGKRARMADVGAILPRSDAPKSRYRWLA